MFSKLTSFTINLCIDFPPNIRLDDHFTAGELKEGLPEDIEQKVKEIFASYAKNALFKYISNLDDVD